MTVKLTIVTIMIVTIMIVTIKTTLTIVTIKTITIITKPNKIKNRTELKKTNLIQRIGRCRTKCGS